MRRVAAGGSASRALRRARACARWTERGLNVRDERPASPSSARASSAPSLALRLAQGGARVTLLERAPTPGGLAGADRLRRAPRRSLLPRGRPLRRAHDRARRRARARRARCSFTPVGVGFFIDGEMHPFNGVGDFLRFRPLSPLGRARLAWFVAQCQLRRDYAALEDIPLEQLAHAPLRAQGRGAHLAPAARLALRRAPRGAARDVPVGAHQPHALARAPGGGGGERMGVDRGRWPRTARARRRAAGARARRGGAPRRRRRGTRAGGERRGPRRWRSGRGARTAGLRRARGRRR